MRRFVNVIALDIRKPTVETCLAECTIKPEWPPLTEVSRFPSKSTRDMRLFAPKKVTTKLRFIVKNPATEYTPRYALRNQTKDTAFRSKRSHRM